MPHEDETGPRKEAGSTEIRRTKRQRGVVPRNLEADQARCGKPCGWQSFLKVATLGAFLFFAGPGLVPAAMPTLPEGRYLISKWETTEGLPENSATAIAQTPDGYLWIGTFNGLVRFDGVRFVVFNSSNTPEFPNNAVINLHRDLAGRLWLSTYLGLVLYQDGKWKRVGVGTSWTNRIVRSFAENRSGIMCATSFDGAVCRLANGELFELPAPSPLGPDQGCRGHVDPAGAIWVARDELLCHWSGTNWVRAAGEQEATRQLESLVENQSGALLVLARNALHRLEGGRLVQSTPLSQPIQFVWSALESRDGTIWAASYRDGLYRIDPRGQVERWTETNGLTQNALRCTFEDREGNFWIGSSGGGLMQLRPRTVWTFDTAVTLPNRVVKSLSEEVPGRILVATYGGKVVRLESGKVDRFMDQVATFTYAQCVRTDRSGRIWMGSYGNGVLIRDPDGGQRTIPVAETGGSDISALFEDSNGRMWIGGNQAIAVHEGDRFRLVSEAGGSSIPSVTCFAEHPTDGSIWAVSPRTGLYRCAGGSGSFIDGPGGKPIEGVHVVFEPDQSLWVATEASGLLRLRGGKWSRVTTLEGLVTDAISSMLPDNLGNFWLGSNRGIMRVSRPSLHAVADGRQPTADVRVFTVSDGLASIECSAGFQPNAIQDSRRRLWFATLKGVAMIDPAVVVTDSNPPPVVVETIHFVDRDGRPQSQVIRSSDQIRIPAGSAGIVLTFAALHLRAPEKVRFVHELKRHGRVLDRSETTARFSSFALLPPGDYEFSVKAMNADRVWSLAPATLGFVVLPFYWQTGWFRWLAALTILGGSGGTVWQVFHRRMRRQHEAHQQERALADQQARLASVLEGTSDFVGFADPDGRTLYVNPAGRKLVGRLPDEDLSKMRIRDFHSPAHADYVAQTAIPWALQHGTWSGENVLRRADGTESPVSQVIVAHQDAGGRLLFFSTIARDISEQRRTEQALRASEEALRAFMNALPEPALMVDRQGTLLMVNEALARSLGDDPRELIGRNAYRLLPPEVARQRKEAIDLVLATGRPASFEDTRDNRHFINYLSPIADAGGKPSRVAVFAMDISDREQAEEALRSLVAGTATQSGSDFFRSLVQGLVQIFGVKYAFVGELTPDRSQVRAFSVWAGGAAAEPFEYALAHTPCEEVIGNKICIHREGVQALFPQDLLLRQMGVESYMGAPLVDKSGQPLGILVVLHDQPMTETRHHHSIFSIFASRAGAELERVRAEEALRHSEARLRAIVHNTPNVAVQGYNLRGEVTLWNEASTHMFGWTADEATGRTLDQLFHSPDEAAAFNALLREIAGTGRAVGPEEYHFRRRNGENAWCLSTLFEIPGFGDSPMFVCMDVDVTGRKQAEQDLRDLAGRLMEVQDQERRRIGRDLHDSTGQTLAVLEINLAVARRGVEAASPSIQNLLDECMTLAAQCSNEIRTTSYLLHPPLLDEVGLVSALKWFADGFSRRSQIQVGLLLPDHLERLTAEQELTLFRLVQEALTNVHRHSRSTSAEISLQRRDQAIIVEVRDAGAGIPLDELSNFRQGGTALGVGLAGMRQRLRQLGGTLEIESRPGATIVTAALPAPQPLRDLQP